MRLTIKRPVLKQTILAVGWVVVFVPRVHAQQCLHGSEEAADQQQRRRQALNAVRAVNTLQANQAGAAQKKYLRQEELATELAKIPFAGSRPEWIEQLKFARGEEVLPGWGLELDLTMDGYWLMVKDKNDPCGFAFISNESGLIYTAQPIR